MLRFVITAFLLMEFMLIGGESFCTAQINVSVHLDKERYLAGEPAYLIWEYTNVGSTAVPFDRLDLCDFTLRAAAEAGGGAAVDRLLNLASQGSPDREAALYALGLTGSERAVKALIDALPSLPDYVKFSALTSLRTLTHYESKQKSYDAKVKEWQHWWANGEAKVIYNPRDWSTETTPLDCGTR